MVPANQSVLGRDVSDGYPVSEGQNWVKKHRLYPPIAPKMGMQQ